jgi:flagellar biosynthesis protein FlhA
MDRAQLAGYTVVDVPSVIATHITEIIKNYSYELLGKQDVQKLLDTLLKTQPKVVEDLIPNQLHLGVVQRVLQNLLRERITIRDLQTILETLSDYATITKDPETLAEHVRQSLARSITRQIQNPDGSVSVIVVDPQIERLMMEAIQTLPQGTQYINLEPGIVEKIISSMRENFETGMMKGHQPVILTAPATRRFFRKMAERISNSLMVVSHAEMAPNTKVYSIGTVRLD